MNWLTKSVLPKIKAFVNNKEVKENLWIKCSSCEQMIFSKDLYENLNICTTCNFHMPFYPKERLKFLLDDNSSYVTGTTIPVDGGTQAAFIPPI